MVNPDFSACIRSASSFLPLRPVAAFAGAAPCSNGGLRCALTKTHSSCGWKSRPGSPAAGPQPGGEILWARAGSPGAGGETEGSILPARAATNRWREEALLRSSLPGSRGKERRFDAPYDRIHRGDVLWEAWRRVRRNGGAAGVDEITLQAIDERVLKLARQWLRW